MLILAALATAGAGIPVTRDTLNGDIRPRLQAPNQRQARKKARQRRSHQLGRRARCR